MTVWRNTWNLSWMVMLWTFRLWLLKDTGIRTEDQKNSFVLLKNSRKFYEMVRVIHQSKLGLDLEQIWRGFSHWRSPAIEIEIPPAINYKTTILLEKFDFFKEIIIIRSQIGHKLDIWSLQSWSLRMALLSVWVLATWCVGLDRCNLSWTNTNSLNLLKGLQIITVNLLST